MLILILYLTAVQGYSLQGCFTPVSNQFVNPSIALSSNVSVQACVDQCVSSQFGNDSFTLIMLPNCYCFSLPNTSFASVWTPVNPVECNQKCSDGLPCGDEAHQRYSIYALGPISNATVKHFSSNR